MYTLDHIIRLMKEIREMGTSWKRSLQELDYIITENAYEEQPDSIEEIIGNFSFDLSFHIDDRRLLGQDPSYFGDEKLPELIDEALKRLSNLGVDIDE